MENNVIPLDVYKKLAKKLKIIRILLLLFVLALAGIFAFCFSKFFHGSLIKTIIPTVALLAFAAWGWVIIFGEKFSRVFFKSMMKAMALVYNWVCDEKFEDTSWDFIEDADRYQLLYDSFYLNKENFLLCGQSCNRNFSLYFLYPSSNKSLSEDFLLIKTTPITNFNNVILITPIIVDDEDDSERELTKVPIDTQDFFDVYAKDPQNVTDILSQDFINALIKHVETTGGLFSILITPQGVLIARELSPEASIFFSSADKYIHAYWNTTESLIKILDVINLLEKK